MFDYLIIQHGKFCISSFQFQLIHIFFHLRQLSSLFKRATLTINSIILGIRVKRLLEKETGNDITLH